MMRGSQADVKRPKLSAVKLLLTSWNCVWLKVLKVSTRNSSRLPRVSLKTKLLKSDTFQLSRPGARSALWGKLPKVPRAGRLKAEGSMYWICCLLLGPVRTVCGYEIEPLRFGRFVALGRPLPPCPPLIPMLIGSPDSMVTIPEACQPPSVAFRSLL